MISTRVVCMSVCICALLCESDLRDGRLQTNRHVHCNGGMSLPRTLRLYGSTRARRRASRTQPRGTPPRAQPTQGALAKAAGVPRSTISNLESSSGNPSLTVLVKVAGALSVPLDELLASPRAKVRKWGRAELASQSGGRGVAVALPDPGARTGGAAQRHGVRARCVDARLAAPARHARVLHVHGGRGHDLRCRRSLRSRCRRRACIPRQRAAFVQESRQQSRRARRVRGHPRQVRHLDHPGDRS